MKDTGRERHIKQQVKDLQEENKALREKLLADPAASPQQVEALRRQISALREENRKLHEGLQQIQMSVDAIMVSMAMKYGEDRGVGYHLSFASPDLELLDKYEVKVTRGEEEYTVGAVLKSAFDAPEEAPVN